MAISSTIETAFAMQYGSTLYTLSQQLKSKFVPLVRQETVNGESRSFDRFGEAEVEDITTRYPDTPLNEIPNTRRWVTPAGSHTACMVDPQDEAQMILRPTSKYQQLQAAAFGRKNDEIIISAALGTAAAGKTPTTASVAFQDESISINGDGTATTLGTLAAVATIVDITLAKMQLMLLIYNQEDVDPDMKKYWAVHPKTTSDMLGLTQVGSADYNTIKTLTTGKVEYFMGFHWFWSNQITKDAATETGYRSISFVSDGLVYGSAEALTTRIGEHPGKSYVTQIYARQRAGAVRMEGAKVHECLNKVA